MCALLLHLTPDPWTSTQEEEGSSGSTSSSEEEQTGAGGAAEAQSEGVSGLCRMGGEAVCSSVQEQGELVWKVRDQLQAQLSTAELKQLLEANLQATPSGESRVNTLCHSHLLYMCSVYIRTVYCPSTAVAAGLLC